MTDEERCDRCYWEDTETCRVCEFRQFRIHKELEANLKKELDKAEQRIRDGR